MGITYQLAVIGGGINGVAIARDAALRGIRTILLEKGTLASGASSKSSNLAHGGLRYLEQGQFGLVKESLQERNLLLQNAASYVQSCPFVFPVYRTSKRPLWQVKLGLTLYDWFASPSPFPNHHSLSVKQVENQYPLLSSEGLRGACIYFDAQMDDKEIVLQNARSAEVAGATILTSVTITEFIKQGGQLRGLHYTDKEGGAHQINAECIVSVSGAWANQVLQKTDPKEGPIVQPSKGVHILTEPLPYKEAFILEAPQDGRIFFVMPKDGHSLIGTTDTLYNDDPDKVSVEPEDIDYLMTAARHYFPVLSNASIIDSYAGLRPLAISKKTTASSIGRDMLIHQSPSGLWSMVGGKYTTYRRMAETMVDNVVNDLEKSSGSSFRPCKTKELPL